MERFDRAVHRPMRWVQPKMLDMAYELRDGDAPVATLAFRVDWFRAVPGRDAAPGFERGDRDHVVGVVAEPAGKAQAMRVVRTESTIVLVPDEQIDLVVTRPVGIPEQFMYEWPAAPFIEGSAVRFVGRRDVPPPADIDGGVTTVHYDLLAVAPGAARVVVTPRLASREAVQPAVVLSITVRAAEATGACTSQRPRAE